MIAAGAVVTQDVQPCQIVAGVPAPHVRFRIDDAMIQRLRRSPFRRVGLDDGQVSTLPEAARG